MSERKNNLDEMQEQKLLKIEHYGVLLAFWGLVIAILIQVILGGKDLLRNTIGEWIVFMCLDIYLLVACMKNGIWDRKLKPNLRTNIIVSLITSIVCGILFFATSYNKYHKLSGSICSAIFSAAFIFGLTLIALSISKSIYKKRLEKLERDIDE